MIGFQGFVVIISGLARRHFDIEADERFCLCQIHFTADYNKEGEEDNEEAVTCSPCCI